MGIAENRIYSLADFLYFRHDFLMNLWQISCIFIIEIGGISSENSSESIIYLLWIHCVVILKIG